MGWNLTPLGLIQKIPSTQLIGTSTLVGTTLVTLYTCPAGKKATILAFADQSVALGTNTIMNAKIKGLNLRNLIAVETAVVNENIQGSVLLAGDTIQFGGNGASNNGTVNYFISVQELPA